MFTIQLDAVNLLAVRGVNMDIVQDDTLVAILNGSEELELFTQEQDEDLNIITVKELRDGEAFDFQGGEYSGAVKLIKGFNQEVSNFKLEPNHFNFVGRIGNPKTHTREELQARIKTMRAKHNQAMLELLKGGKKEMVNIREVVIDPISERDCIRLVQDVRDKLTADIKELEEFAKKKNLYLSYDRRDTQFRERLNKQFLTYPQINPSSFDGLGVRVHKLLESSLKNLTRDINYSFKFNKKMSSQFQVKATYYRYMLDIRVYIEKAKGIDIGYISEYANENDEKVIQKFQNGNMIIQFTEEQFNTIKELSRLRDA